MAREVKTRTQRRMERKQAILLLVMMLAVSLVSFSLGVMVGKSGAPGKEQMPTVQAPERQEVVKTPVNEPEKAVSSDEEPVAGKQEKTPLTFFDTLPKGEESPLGSGINRPPEKAAPPAAKDLSQALEKAREQATEPEKAPVVQSEKTGSQPPAPAEDGRYVVQVGSFRSPEDARSLGGRLEKMNLPVFVQQADLGAKGLWYRVRVGPFAAAGDAKKIVARLKAEEDLDAFVATR